MTLTEKEFNRLNAMCKRIEYVFKWTPGTLQGKSSARDVTQIRDQIILDAWEQGTTQANLRRYFNKTRQSIHRSLGKAKKDRDYMKKYHDALNLLCDVD